MIRIENTQVFGFEAAIRGMRNPMNSWEMSDSKWYSIGIPTSNKAAINDKYLSQKYCIGDNDLGLMRRLVKAGTDHSKFMRMIIVTMDITAPLYWWKEFDTYKVGTVANSCSTMHKIHAKKFTLNEFSHEHLEETGIKVLEKTIQVMNEFREEFLKNNNKDDWWQMIQLLPSSYNQKRTV